MENSSDQVVASPPAGSADMALSRVSGVGQSDHDTRLFYAVTFRPVERKHIKLCNTLAETFFQWTVQWGLDLVHQFEEYIPYRHIHATVATPRRLVYKDMMLKGYHIFLIPVYDLPKWIEYCEKTKVPRRYTYPSRNYNFV